MTVKTITVTEDAYDAMYHLKHEGESFSELFIRLSHTPLKVKDLLGALKDAPEEASAFVERVKKIREEAGKGWEERIADVRARFRRIMQNS
ncbi:antitoxin VapB family protein [Candidatus Woesearchaeota archaeon]|nr:antitoxin VapB family protein [Candidatus Woesearchaeota archaeon]